MNRPNRRGIAATLLLTAAILFSCTKVDNQFGDDFIPDDEQMKVCLDTLRGIDTYLTESDSFPTSGMVYGYMGSGWDPVFGRTKASFCAQYNMNYFTTGSEMFGIAPVFDSLMLWLTFNGSFYGDSSKTQKFNIYELTGYLDSDTTYYADFDPSSIVSDKVLFSFEITGVPSEEVMLKLDSEAAIEFAHRLMDTTGGTYTSDSRILRPTPMRAFTGSPWRRWRWGSILATLPMRRRRLPKIRSLLIIRSTIRCSIRPMSV